MVSIIDLGIGNIGSIINMLKYLNYDSEIINNASGLKGSQKIILPGVGSFDYAMQKLNESGIKEVLDQKAKIEKIPILGICLGMQLLTNCSEEGNLQGLGYISAETKCFKNEFERKNIDLPVPHMGWNKVNILRSSELINDIRNDYRFYHVHSFYVKCGNDENRLMEANYGIKFDTAIYKDNIYGVQFHPEKSHKMGIKLFKNFVLM